MVVKAEDDDKEGNGDIECLVRVFVLGNVAVSDCV